MILILPWVLPTGGLAIIPCINPVMTRKRIPTTMHETIRLATWSGAPFYGTTSSPSLMLRPVPGKVRPKQLWEIKTPNPRCYGGAVIGMPFHLPCAWQDVPDSCPCILIHLCGQSHHAEGRGKISKVFGLNGINTSLQCSNYINVCRVMYCLQECYTFSTIII
jgi:hypothetical protein